VGKAYNFCDIQCILLGISEIILKIGLSMNKKLLFFLCIIMSLCCASEYLNEHVHEVLGSPFPCTLDIFTTPNQRKYQEDRVLYSSISQKGWLFGVMDGHGGVETADYVIQNLPRKFAQGLVASLTERQYCSCWGFTRSVW
jgi:hypothetical protein